MYSYSSHIKENGTSTIRMYIVIIRRNGNLLFKGAAFILDTKNSRVDFMQSLDGFARGYQKLFSRFLMWTCHQLQPAIRTGRLFMSLSHLAINCIHGKKLRPSTLVRYIQQIARQLHDSLARQPKNGLLFFKFI